VTNRTRYTISLLPSDNDIIKHLENVKEHSTISMYIRNLIKSDLNGSYRGNPDINLIVEKVIQRIKEDGELQFSADHEEISISDEQRGIISSLF
jgi:hypothetical protein